MVRNCPNCAQPTIPIRELLTGRCRCPSCQLTVGIQPFASFLFSILAIAVTVGTSIGVFMMFGIYAVIVWFMFPVGAISYIKARYCPLVAYRAGEAR